MKTRIKKGQRKNSNENRPRRGRKQKGNVFRALSRGRLVSRRRRGGTRRAYRDWSCSIKPRRDLIKCDFNRVLLIGQSGG